MTTLWQYYTGSCIVMYLTLKYSDMMKRNREVKYSQYMAEVDVSCI
jgi:hypothetical protein